MKTNTYFNFFLGFVLLFALPDLSSAQDRQPSRNVIYPEAAFASFNADTTRISESGRVIDVTRPPFNATGDGVTDDTDAINAAYTFLAEQIQEFGWQTGSNQGSYILYFPSGTYSVSNTLIHNLGNIQYTGNNPVPEGVTWVRFVGQDRENTIIKLQDNSPGFGAGTRKELVSFQKKGVGDREGNNIPGACQVSDLTIDTGNGNPGAVGIYWMSANTGEMSNVLIKSSDGQGYAGIDMPTFSVQGHYRDLTIEGFDYGISASWRGENNPTYEYISMSGQNIAAVLVDDGAPIFRKTQSINDVPFALIIADESMVLVIDSDLQSNNADVPALDLQNSASQLFVRNTTISGYGSSVRIEGEDVVSGDIEEYVSDEVYTLFEGIEEKTLGLPIIESPILEWEQDLTQWANVDEFPGANDTERVQNAMNSGLPVVYFPKAGYDLQGQIFIPASVKHIDFLYSRPGSNGEFVISESGPDLLFIDHNNRSRANILQTAARDVVMRNLSFDNYSYTATGSSTMYLESTAGFGSTNDFCPTPLTIYGRSINNEEKGTSSFKIYGGTLWTMGFKTESQSVAFDVTDGGIAEVLGGYRNEVGKFTDEPFVLNDNTNVSFIGYSHLSGGGDVLITEVRDGIEQNLLRSQVPPRGSGAVMVPLYVGTTDAVAPACLPPVVEESTTTTTTAEVFWSDPNGQGTSYEVRYRTLNSDTFEIIESVVDTTATIPDLLPGLNYEWEVRANCGDEFSDWSAPGNFTTDLNVGRNGGVDINVDGVLDEEDWNIDTNIDKVLSGSGNNDASFGLLWDNTYLYVGVMVLDESLFNDSENTFQDDAVEFYIDPENDGGPYGEFDYQLIKRYNDEELFINKEFNGTVLHGTTEIEGGYVVELAIPWSGLNLVPGNDLNIGFDVSVDDDDDGGDRDGQIVWSGTGINFRDATNFGDIILQGSASTESVLKLHYTWDGITTDEVIGFESNLDSIVSFSPDAAIGSSSLKIMGDSIPADGAAIAIPGGSLLNSGFTTRSYSLWAKLRDTEPSQILFEEGGDGSGVAFQVENDSVAVIFRHGGGDAFTTLNVPFADSEVSEEFVHLAVTYEEGIIGAYVNGELAGSAISPVGSIPSHNNPPSLGGIRNNQSASNDNTQYVDGFLDEFKVFDGVLTQDEITELADRPVILPPATLAVYFPWNGVLTDEVSGLESSFNSVATFSPDTPFGSNGVELNGLGIEADDSAIAIDNGSILNGSFEFRSYSLWVKARDTQSQQILFEEGGTQGGAGFQLQNGNLLVLFRSGGGSNFSTLEVPFPATAGEPVWNHLAITYAAGVITAYINGEEAGLEVTSTVAVPGHNNPPSLGGIRNNQSPTNDNTFYFDGFLDEFKVYEGILTSDEIQNLAEELPVEGGLVVDWSLEETEGTSVQNSAGAGNTGNIIGGTAADLTTEGIVGNAFDFNPQSATEGPIVGLGEQIFSGFPFSASAWVNIDAPQFSQLFTVNDSTINRNFVSIGITNLNLEDGSQGTQAFILADDNDGTPKRVNSGINIRGEWHHLTLIHENPNLRKLYVDGVLAVSDTVTFDDFTFDNQRLTLGGGRRGDFNGQRFRGKVDEFKLYTDVISEEEIEAMRVAPIAVQVADSLEISLDSTDVFVAAQLIPVFSEQGIIYSSTDEDVLTVDQAGLITPISAGISFVVVTSEANTAVSDSVRVNIIGDKILEGDFKLINKKSDKVLAVDLNPFTNGFKWPKAAGANVHQWNDDEKSNKVWSIEASSEDGYYKLVNRYSNKVLALDPHFYTNGFRRPKDAGANVYQWYDTGEDNTLWKIEPAEQEGYYTLTNKLSGKVLALDLNFFTNGFKRPNDPGANIHQWINTGRDNVLWRLEETDDDDDARPEESVAASNATPEVPNEISIKVYPNPVENIVRFDMDLPSGQRTFSVNVANLSGQTVMANEAMGLNDGLDLSGLSPGVYLVIIDNGIQKVTKEIIKK